MRKADLIKFSAEMLKQLHEIGIRMDDYKHLDMFRDYEAMRGIGEKMTYIVAYLSRKYDICERKVYKLISRFSEDCQSCAVE